MFVSFSGFIDWTEIKVGVVEMSKNICFLLLKKTVEILKIKQEKNPLNNWKYVF